MADSLLDTLKFIKGAISKKADLGVPVLTHFSIHESCIRGSNGIIALGAPIPLSLSAQPQAIPFTKAIEICEGLGAIPSLSLTPSGRLTVAAGAFRVHIECSTEIYPELYPEGIYADLQPGLLQAFKTLAPMIGQDASRPWARGILIREGSCFATNNVVIGQYWIGFRLPYDLNIPDECITEVLRVGKEPVGITASERSVTFHFSDGRWIRSQLLSTVWPNVAPVLDRPCNPQPIPRDFFHGLQLIQAYCDATRAVYFRGNRNIQTHELDEIGASIILDADLCTSAQLKGKYNIDQLSCLDGQVVELDFTLYPAPCIGFGPKNEAGYSVFRCAIVGMRTT